MVICDPEDNARHLSGATYFMRTPEDFAPLLTIYFTTPRTRS
jgi:hypothetical protein